jgi:hypothetical protein
LFSLLIVINRSFCRNIRLQCRHNSIYNNLHTHRYIQHLSLIIQYSYNQITDRYR